MGTTVEDDIRLTCSAQGMRKQERNSFGSCAADTADWESTRFFPPNLERAIAALRQAEDVPDHLLAHLSPLGWEHVNLTGDYIWSAERPAAENSDGFRALRAAPDAVRKAA